MSSRPLPLVSIVTPEHNEARWLGECIESILAQTYQNWEYTIVDNRSSDGSLEIARRYAARDRRIRVRETPQFLSAVANHNFALRQISTESKYCKVVLGDDWIFPDSLERMVEAAEEHPSAGIVGAYAIEGDHVKWTGLPYPSPLVSGREICRKHLLQNIWVFGTPSTVLYRADLVRNHHPVYNEASLHADTEACFALLKESDFAFVHQVLAFSRVRPGSLTATSADVNTHFGGVLRTLLAHGRDYLSDNEFDACFHHHLSEYYAFLGKSLIFGRDNAFWEYHKRELRAVGVGFSPVRIAKGALAMLIDAVLNPKAAIEKLRRRRGGRSRGRTDELRTLPDRGWQV